MILRVASRLWLNWNLVISIPMRNHDIEENMSLIDDEKPPKRTSLVFDIKPLGVLDLQHLLTPQILVCIAIHEVYTVFHVDLL